jgi:hypothetical protein
MDLQHFKTFAENTSQGIVGLLRPFREGKKILKLNNTTLGGLATDYLYLCDEPEVTTYVFKICKEVNSLSDHELKVSKDMEELTSFLPHFNKVIEVHKNVKCFVPEEKYFGKLCEKFNPFQNHNCFRDVSIIEYIPSKLTLLKYIEKRSFKGYTDTLIHQLILGLFIAQQEKNFCHYDLHLENVLLRTCAARTFFWYKFSYKGAIMDRLVYCGGYFPVIFDYGSAYSKGLDSTSYNNSLYFTNKGYTPYMFDEIVDFRTLMVRLSNVRGCPEVLKKLTYNYFLKSKHLNFKIDKKTGWFKSNFPSCSRKICTLLSATFDECDILEDDFMSRELEDVIELLGVLIKTPFTYKDFDTSTLTDVFRRFTREWSKIDHWFTSPDDKLNIFKAIVTVINQLIIDTESNVDASPVIDKQFRLRLFEILDEYGEFVNIDDLDSSGLMVSIVDMSFFVESICTKECELYQKNFNFSHLDSWTIFKALEEIVVPDKPFKFQKDDAVVLFDCVDKTTSSFELTDTEIIDQLNRTDDLHTQISLINNLKIEDFL